MNSPNTSADDAHDPHRGHPQGQQSPPPVANPYGPDPQAAGEEWGQSGWQQPQQSGWQQPQQSGWQQPPQQLAGPYTQGWNQHGGMYPPVPGQYPQPPRRKRQRDAEPGRFTWWDLGATVVYVGGFLTGLVGLLALLPPIAGLVTSEDEVQTQFGLFLVNAVSYGLLAAMTLALSAAALWRSIKRLAYLWWLKLLLVPVGWVVMTVVTTVIVVFGLGADPETSENQAAIDAMLGSVPFVAAVVVLAMLGPYVEEFFFRHLLIGKLSRYINVWICGVISIVTFPLLHFIPALVGLADDLSLAAVVPYVVMGILITVGYIVTGRNLFYAWLLHAFNNFVALLMAYFVQPWAEDALEQFEDLEAAFAVVGAMLKLVS